MVLIARHECIETGCLISDRGGLNSRPVLSLSGLVSGTLMHSKTPLLRPPLGLWKNGIYSGWSYPRVKIENI